MKKATISLSIIVKNESNVILKMLNSVYTLLDYYVVVDTGSTDNTKEIVKNFFDEKGIPGEIIDHTWINYGDARNVALQNTLNKADFGFWIDADDQLVIDKNFDIDNFKQNLIKYDGMLCNYIRNLNHCKFNQLSFFSTKSGWKWYGALHEIIYHEEINNLNIDIINGLTIHQYQTGNSWSNPNKWKDYLVLIENFIKTTDKNHFLYSRWIFYLASTYYDTKDYAKALQTYKERTLLNGGYVEEVYISFLKIAELKKILKYDEEEIINSYLKCTEENPNRVDHIIPIIEYYNSIKKYNIAYIYSSYAMKFAGKYPNNTTLLIDFSIYDWRIYDSHNISSWWSGHINEAKETFKLLWSQVENGLVDDDQIPRITENKKYNM